PRGTWPWRDAGGWMPVGPHRVSKKMQYIYGLLGRLLAVPSHGLPISALFCGFSRFLGDFRLKAPALAPECEFSGRIDIWLICSIFFSPCRSSARAITINAASQYPPGDPP